MRLLIIGNARNEITQASLIAKNHGAKVTHCPDNDSALSLLLSGKSAEVVMIDASMDIAGLIAMLEQHHISVPVIAYGLDNDSRKAVNAIKAGAQEYVPFPPDEELISAILEAITAENDDMVASSAAMQAIVKMAGQIAPSHANVLITGDSGTGKEVISRYIHRKSKRADQNFISVNCAAIPENLLESELFGHEKGAFTGATSRRIGKFEESTNGTLLLDEISEMDLRLQAKLLRAIQEQEITRVGSNEPVKLNLRILATSNRDLPTEIKEGRFRQDLFFRLNVIHLQLPPLAQRQDDIEQFSLHFIEKYAKVNEITVPTLPPHALEILKNYSWPGNVRELENTLHRAVLLCTDGVISENQILLEGASQHTEAEDPLSAPLTDSTSSAPMVGRTVESVERSLILDTLDHCLGNRTQAANILGISIRTLRNKLKQYEENSSS